jgi:hypothetical protein
MDRRIALTRLVTGTACAASTWALLGRATASINPLNTIQRENQRPGTRDWMLAKTQIDPATKYRCPWIEGYCSHASASPGERIDFFVSTNPASDFTIDIFRLGYYQGQGGRHVASLGMHQGKTQPDPDIGPKRLRECRWLSSAQWTVPEDAVSGVYLAKLTAQVEGWQSYVIWIVRDTRSAHLAFQCSDHTWQAYNRWPSQFSLYDDGQETWYWGGGVQVSFRRPYGKYCQILDAPLSTGSGEFLLWEFPMAYWLESKGYDVTYLSNRDTHADVANLTRCKGFLSVGHDEYWTIQMFENAKKAVAAGVNLAFFSGNAVCGRIVLDPERDAFERVGVFGPPEGTIEFKQMRTLRHERPYANELMGAHSTGPVTGGADWTCQLPQHWLFENTGMKQGDSIPGLVGWEWHGDPAPIPGLQVVASGPTQSAPGRPNGGQYTSTVYPGPKGNFVFNAATIWWSDGLSEPPGYVRPKVYTEPKGPHPWVQKITENVLARMLSAT